MLLGLSTPDDAALVLFVASHVEKTSVCNGKDVRRQFPQPSICVHVHMLGGVDGQQLVGVHCHQDGACVRLQTERDVGCQRDAHLMNVFLRTQA